MQMLKVRRTNDANVEAQTDGRTMQMLNLGRTMQIIIETRTDDANVESRTDGRMMQTL